jgi:2-oxoglutarate ferredoxin oxidoreductase subunit alpha
LEAPAFLPKLVKALRVIAVEGNAGGQFAGLLRREAGFHIDKFVTRYDGLPMTPTYIRAAVERIIKEEA